MTTESTNPGIVTLAIEQKHGLTTTESPVQMLQNLRILDAYTGAAIQKLLDSSENHPQKSGNALAILTQRRAQNSNINPQTGGITEYASQGINYVAQSLNLDSQQILNLMEEMANDASFQLPEPKPTSPMQRMNQTLSNITDTFRVIQATSGKDAGHDYLANSLRQLYDNLTQETGENPRRLNPDSDNEWFKSIIKSISPQDFNGIFRLITNVNDQFPAKKLNLSMSSPPEHLDILTNAFQLQTPTPAS